MTDPRDQFIPYWLQTAMRSGTDGGLLGGLPHPDPSFSFPWEYPWPYKSPLDMWAKWPTSIPSAPPPFSPTAAPSSWDPSSPVLRQAPVSVNAGFLAPPAEPVVEPWSHPRLTTYPDRPPASMTPPRPFTPSPAFSPAPSLDHLDSGKYWPVGPAPLGAAVQPPAHGSYFPPMAQPPSWDQVPMHPADRAASLFPEPVIRHMGSARSGIVDGGPRTNGVSAETDPQVLSDATPDNNWLPGAQYVGVGHHHSPRAVFRKFALPPETRQVFEKATTGPLPFHGWHQYDELHRLYSNAVEDLMKRFIQEHNIKAQQMTPDHARSVLRAIAESEDPRIRAFRAMLQHMGRLYRLRTGGRGSE
jgi:hypothetical protein